MAKFPTGAKMPKPSGGAVKTPTVTVPTAKAPKTVPTGVGLGTSMSVPTGKSRGGYKGGC